jgi:hypothetical protein
MVEYYATDIIIWVQILYTFGNIIIYILSANNHLSESYIK